MCVCVCVCVCVWKDRLIDVISLKKCATFLKINFQMLIITHKFLNRIPPIKIECLKLSLALFKNPYALMNVLKKPNFLTLTNNLINKTILWRPYIFYFLTYIYVCVCVCVCVCVWLNRTDTSFWSALSLLCSGLCVSHMTSGWNEFM